MELLLEFDIVIGLKSEEGGGRRLRAALLSDDSEPLL